MYTPIRPLLAVALLSLCTSCESAKDALISCLYDFSADVTTGTNAGTQVSGELSLTEAEDGSMEAEMSEASADGIDVDAEVVDGTITLTFSVPSLGEIEGVGAFDAEACLDTIEGELTGPAEDDTGHWLGTLITE